MTEQAASPEQIFWYVLSAGRRHGPYRQQDLLAWIRQGAWPQDAMYSFGGRWLAASEAMALMGPGHGEPAPPEVVSKPPAAPPVPIDAPMDQPLPTVPSTPPPLPAAANEPAAAVQRRDRIVVIGRRASGKTIYLATLYKHLWKAREGLTMKALSGQVHKELIGICETLRKGQWPAATLKTTLAHMEVEVTCHERTRILVGLDYAGEVFRDAFVNDDSQSAEAKALISHIDRAAAVILLIDPAVAVGGDADAFVDDDFGIVQALRRIRDWPGGEKVPIALVLTKADQNLHLFKGKDSTRTFIEAHYPALVRTLGRYRYFHASAVQARRDDKGLLRPDADSVPVNIGEPLKYCLKVLEHHDQKELASARQATLRQAVIERAQEQEAAQRQTQRMFALFIIGLITLGVCIIGLILAFNM